MKFKKMTGDNIGRYIAIVFDGDVRSCPKVNSEIWGGSLEISGGFTKEAAQSLVDIFSSGKLPMPLRIIEVSSH